MDNVSDLDEWAGLVLTINKVVININTIPAIPQDITVFGHYEEGERNE